MSNTTNHLSASTLIGDDITNPQKENLGDLKDFMIDTTSGKISYAVVSYGGILGMGDKLFAVPWSQLTVDHENKCLVLNVSKDRLKDAPGFDKDHWPNFADTSFASKIDTYYVR